MIWMSVFLLYDKLTPDSEWKPWIAMLPNSYAHMPQLMHDSADELGLINHTLALEWVREYQLQFRVEYLDLAAGFAALDEELAATPGGSEEEPWWFGQFSLAQYVWARCAVLSRAFGIDVHQVKRDDEGEPMMAQSSTVMQNEHGQELEPLHVTAMLGADHQPREREPKGEQQGGFLWCCCFCRHRSSFRLPLPVRLFCACLLRSTASGAGTRRRTSSRSRP